MDLKKEQMTHEAIIDWLLDGDPAIRYQVYRDLLNQYRADLQHQIANEGWGARILSLRNKDGHWGLGFYHPKWTSSHYTLLELRHLCISPDCLPARETIQDILRTQKSTDGGLNPAKTIDDSDVCVNGMALNYSTYFQVPAKELKSIIDFILSQQLPDGGFNCEYNQRGARHSSLHSTLSVLEGFTEYLKNGYNYRTKEIQKIMKEAVEFILTHRLYQSDHTGEIIRKDFLHFPYPPRWKYDILRALDYFQYAEIPYDNRMDNALEKLIRKRRKDNRWNQQAKHPGKIHFEMEKAGMPSRWNTLRALRVLIFYTGS